METQSEHRRFLITKIDKEINKLGEIKKMLIDYKGKFPDACVSLTNELLINIEVNLEYLERIFLLKPTKKILIVYGMTTMKIGNYLLAYNSNSES